MQGLAANRPQFAATIRTYVTNRRSYVLSQLNTQFPSVEFGITTNGGEDISTSQPSSVVEGRGWIDVHRILVSRNGGTPLEWL